MARGLNGEAHSAFPPIQARMLKLLSDGLLHTAEELHGCLHDELGPVTNVYAHLTAIRKSLRPKGQDVILIRSNGQAFYQLSRLLGSPYVS